MSDTENPDRHFAVSTNQMVWQLLVRRDRTAEDDLMMLHAAHASLLHWTACGTAGHRQRGLWLVARIYAELGSAQETMRHARACADLTEQADTEMAVWDRAYALDIMARAHALAGNLDQARDLRTRAMAIAETVEEEQSRGITLGDLADGDWTMLD